MRFPSLTILASALLSLSSCAIAQPGPIPAQVNVSNRGPIALRSSYVTPQDGQWTKDTGHLYAYDLGTTSWLRLDNAAGGTVTSVALTVPSFLSIGGSPVTSSGTLAVTLGTQSANIVFAGPTTGSAATPTFRSLVAADIPAIAESGVTGLVSDLALKAPLASPALTGTVTIGGSTISLAGNLTTTGAFNSTFAASGSFTYTLPGATSTLLATNGNGSSLTALNASQLTSGTVPTAQLGSGSATSATYLRGDQTWATITAPVVTAVTAANGLTLTTGTLAFSGAAYSPVAGSSSIVTTGTIGTGTWAGSVIGAQYGGTGIGNNSASTLTWSGSFASTFAISGAFTYTFPGASSTLLATTGSGTGLSGVALLASADILTTNGAASTPPLTLNGTWFVSGGTATTTKPQLLIEPSGTTSTGWSTAGTGLGVNAATGFTGKLLDMQLVGVSKFSVDSTGALSNGGGIVSTSNIRSTATMFATSFGSFTQNASVTFCNNGYNAALTAASFFTGGGTTTNSSGTWIGVGISPIYNQTSTGGDDDLRITRTETALGSGQQNFINLLVGATQRFNVTNTGAVVLASTIKSTGAAPSIAAGTGAGTSPTVAIAAHSSDLAGVVNVTTGTLPTGGGIVATITYNAGAFANGSTVTLTPNNAITGALTGLTAVYANGTTTTFVITAEATGLTAATAYSWNYTVVGN